MKSTGSPLVEIRHVKKSLSKGRATVRVLNGITFDIGSGECVGLVGESGSGKSTLARLLCRIHRQDDGAVLFRGKDIFTYNPKAYYRQVQMVFQDPLASFPSRMTVGRYLLEPFYNFGLLRGVAPDAHAAELLKRVGLSSELFSRFPGQLSGGQLQRIAYARATGLSPALVVCDEVTSALDATTQAQIISLFRSLRAESGFASLFITHDLALAESLCDIVHVMDSGSIVETLTTGNLLSEARHPATRAMIHASRNMSLIMDVARAES